MNQKPKMSVASDLNSTSNNKRHKESTSLTKRMISINDLSQSSNSTLRIKSPRSLLAIKQSGYSPEELHFLSFEQFKHQFPEVIPLPHERQKSRYTFYENHRKEKIAIIANLRSTIIDNDENSKSTQSKKTKSAIDNPNDNELSNQRELDKMIAKNELELMNMVKCSIQNEMILKEAAEKQRIEQEKKERHQQEVQKHREEEELKQQAKREELKRRQDDEEALRQLREKEKMELEHKKEVEKEEKEQLRLAEIAKKQKEDEAKRKSFQDKMDQLQKESNQKIEEKLKEQEQKEKERQKSLEEKHIQLLLQSLRKSQQKKEVLQKNQRKTERQIKEIQMKIIDKQKQNEIKKQLYEEQRLKLIKAKQDQSRLKAEEIQKIIEKNEEIEKKRIIAYNEKQNEIEKKLQELQQQEKEETEKRRMRHLEKAYCIKGNLNMKEEESNEKNNRIIEKQERLEEHTRKLEYNRSKENILKSEELYQHQVLKQEKIRIMVKQQENEREKIFDEIAHKTLQIDQFLQKKKLFTEKKLKLQADISKKKEEYTKKFQRLMNKKSIDDKTLRTMKKMFPNNLEIDNLIMDFNDKEGKKSMRYNQNRLIRNNSQGNRLVIMSNPNHSQEYHKSEENKNELPPVKKDKSTIEGSSIRTNKQLTDKEIIGKVIQYKEKLNQDLLKIVAYEREQEEVREVILNKLKTDKEKEDMDKEFGIKRSEASKRILLKNE